jgi:hypothetical protein
MPLVATANGTAFRHGFITLHGNWPQFETGDSEMHQTIIKLLEAREKADQAYANVLSRLQSVSREATIARKAKKAAHRSYNNTLIREGKPK